MGTGGGDSLCGVGCGVGVGVGVGPKLDELPIAGESPPAVIVSRISISSGGAAPQPSSLEGFDCVMQNHRFLL